MSTNNPLSSNDSNLRPALEQAAGAEMAAGTLPAAPAANVSSDRRADRIELAVRALTMSDLDQAVKLFSSSPGWENYAEKFRGEAIKFMQSPPSAVLGAFTRDGTVVATGCALKEGFDYGYWSITWVMVDSALRGQGVGAQLVRGIEEYMIKAQDEFNNPNCRVLLSAVDEVAEKFYARLGYTTLLRGPLIDDGECFMYRDVRGPGLSLRVDLRKPGPNS